MRRALAGDKCREPRRTHCRVLARSRGRSVQEQQRLVLTKNGAEAGVFWVRGRTTSQWDPTCTKVGSGRLRVPWFILAAAANEFPTAIKNVHTASVIAQNGLTILPPASSPSNQNLEKSTPVRTSENKLRNLEGVGEYFSYASRLCISLPPGAISDLPPPRPAPRTKLRKINARSHLLIFRPPKT